MEKAGWFHSASTHDVKWKSRALNKYCYWYLSKGDKGFDRGLILDLKATYVYLGKQSP